MKRYSDKVIQSLGDLNVKINVMDHETDLMNMVNTNWKQEVKRGGSRTFDTVKINTAVGFGAEIALQSTGHFKSSSPITENAEGLTFAQRKTDLTCEDTKVEVKTMNARYPDWYLSESQATSVTYAARYNDYFLVVGYTDHGFPNYQYKPKYLIDSTTIMYYIVGNTSGFSPYKFDHRRAINKGDCIPL